MHRGGRTWGREGNERTRKTATIVSAGSTDSSGHIKAYREIQEAIPVCQKETTNGNLTVEEWWPRRWRKEDRLKRCLEVGLGEK